MPASLDRPELIKRWDAGVRISVCQDELFGPLSFVTQGQSAALRHVDETAAPDQFEAKGIVKLIRPGKPQFVKQLSLVMNYADLREERATEIITQVIPQAPFWSSIVNIQPHRHKYTLEVLSLALSLAWQIEMRFKHAFACPRPVEYSPQVQPMIATPGHSTLPSGHATEAFAVARVLQSLVGASPASETASQLQRQAARIAQNRTVAGLHFPIDSAAGRLLGHTLGSYFVYRCQGQAGYNERTFDGTQFHGASNAAIDFDHHADLAGGTFNELTTPGRTLTAKSAILKELWKLAQDEWQ